MLHPSYCSTFADYRLEATVDLALTTALERRDLAATLEDAALLEGKHPAVDGLRAIRYQSRALVVRLEEYDARRAAYSLWTTGQDYRAERAGTIGRRIDLMLGIDTKEHA